MVEFDFLSVIYADGVDQMVWIRNVNQNLPEDRKVITVYKNRRVVEIFSFKNLNYDCAKLFITVSDPAKPDCYYSCTDNVLEIGLNSTAKEVRQTFNSHFPGSAKPMVILKMYYVTRQI